MKTKITTLAIVALTMMSCNNSKKTNIETSSEKTESPVENKTASHTTTIENTKWIITTLNGGDMSDRDANGQEIYFILDSKTNRISGNSGCNIFTGTYALNDDNQISFSKLGATKMMCPDAKINESLILSVFENANHYSITNGILALKKAESAPLAEFKKIKVVDEPIVEKYWKLKTLEGKAITMAENQEQEIYLILKSKDNNFTGFAGCNNFSGSYTLEEGNRIRFDKNIAVTMKACPDVAINESEFLKIFELVDNYTINDDVLSLNVGKRAPLAVFEAVYF